LPFDYDPKTRTYSLRISIGDKEPLSFEDMRVAVHRAIGGTTGQLVRLIAEKRDIEFTDTLFWVEEGWW